MEVLTPEREPFPKLVLSSCHRVQYLSLNRGVRKNEINECMSIVMRGADADTAVHTAALRERVVAGAGVGRGGGNHRDAQGTSRNARQRRRRA